jgi:hypothetical protein
MTMSILLILSFTISCKEEERKGICLACCDANGNKFCEPNFTEGMCADYNNRKVNGYSWTFEEKDICPPVKPN